MKPEQDQTNQPVRNETFNEYRERVHANDRQATSPNKVMRAIFGTFMFILYVGVGILLLINFFEWGPDWTWCRYVIGIVLIIYGIFRGYRQLKGEGYYQQ